MSRKKVALVHHNILSHRGGGDLVASWMLDSLKDDFDLTFITWGGKIDWNEVDRFYGTSISKNPIPVIHHPVLSALGIENRPYRLIIALLEKYLKGVSKDFDILISTYNELDMGPEAIQYIHGPSRSEAGAKKYLLKYHKSFLRGLYYRFCDWYSGFDIENVRRNYTLVNSNWTSGEVKATFGDSIRTETVYPPVFLLSEPKPWESRENAFLIVGDILPEKKTHLAADVIAKLRERGHDVTLKIVGDTRNEYADFVKGYIKKYPFVSHLGRLNREKVSELIASTKYGIHMRDYEGFGIALAEMVRGGAIPFAVNKGGQVEVMGSDPEILFEDADDAVEKIHKVLSDAQKQKGILARLKVTGENFSAETFRRQVISVVQKRLESKTKK